MTMKPVFIFLGFLLLSFFTQAQDLTKADYKRAVSFMYDNYNNKTAFNLYTRVSWWEDGSGLYFTSYDTTGKSYKTIDFRNYKVQDLFDHEKIATQLNEILKDSLSANKLSFDLIEKNKEGQLFIEKNKRRFEVIENDELKEIQKEETEEASPYESKSPDGKWIAFVKDYNLFMRSTETSDTFQLSTDGKKNYEYASWYGWGDLMEGENGERPQRFYVNWAEDSKWIATNICDLRNANKMYLLDFSVDTLYRPQLWSYYRGSPGDTNMVYMQPVFFNVETKKEVKTDLPKNTHINNVAIEWTEASGVALANYSERGYQKEYVFKIDLNKNTSTTLVKETSETNIDNFRFWQMEGKEKMVFLSERSGWRQLYWTDLEGTKTHAITKGDFYIHSVEYIDDKNEVIYFLASGIDPKANPYHRRLYRTDLNGNITALTPENLHHQIDFSDDGKYFVDNYSSITVPTRTVLRNAEDGKILAELTQADISHFTQKGWKAPEVFQLIGKDGKTPIYGAIWKPTNFDPNKKYPIIDNAYTGPHTKVFPKSFSGIFSSQSLAELGFIVMKVDGLGSSGRSKDFHNHSYKNMGDNLRDHVLAIQYLAQKHSWIDGERVGIYGHSAGGFDAGHAMLAFPETYKVAVASSADHDFRMEKAWWPEMYMGWPVDESYHEVSNITMADRLEGKLLLVHGAMDENVNPSATYKLAEALIKADKEFDLLIMPSQNHGYRGQHRKYFLKKRWNYFVEHLRGVEAIWDFDWE